MEANIAAMADFISSRGKVWRPHQKCHKSPAIAQLQIAAGATGVTCAKVSEAEVMVRDAERRTRPVFLERESGAWRINLERSVPRSVREEIESKAAEREGE